MIGPSLYFYLGNGAYGSVGKDAFGTADDGFDVSGLRSVPPLQGTDAAAVSYHQDIVTEPLCQLGIVGIEAALLQLQSLLKFAVGIDGLLLVEVDPVAHQFGFKHRTVSVDVIINIRLTRYGDRLDRSVLL